MDVGDILFYGVIAVSVIGSIAKNFRKKKEIEEDAPTENKGGDIFKKLLDQMQLDDDFIPSNPAPKPVETRASKPVIQPVNQPVASSSRKEDFRKNVEASYYIPEQRDEHNKAEALKMQAELNAVIDEDNELYNEYDLSNPEEFKKAIIYSEILQRKF